MPISSVADQANVAAATRNAVAGWVVAIRMPPIAGPTNDRGALDRRRDRVRGRQILGRGRQRGQERRLGGPERRPGRGDEGEQHVDDDVRAAGVEDDRRDPDQAEAGEVGGDHHAFARQPVAEQPHERRRDRGHEHPQPVDEPEPGQAALLERHDAERQSRHPGAGLGADQRELDPPQRLVRGDGAQTPRTIRAAVPAPSIAARLLRLRSSWPRRSARRSVGDSRTSSAVSVMPTRSCGRA